MAEARISLANLVSFTTLSAGMASIGLAFAGETAIAGALILAGYILDALDGEIARRTQAISQFGIQLDSLVDVVHFGCATAVLLTQHLEQAPFAGWPVWTLATLYVIAGSFRLARFNLTALDNDKETTTGLTISTSGAYLAMAVLADLAFGDRLFPNWLFPPLILLIGILMVSRIPFPELQAVLKHRWVSTALIGGGILSAFWISLPLAWWTVTSLYICFGLARAGARSLH